MREKVDFVPVDERAGVMRIEVDRDNCEGLGMCEAMAHEYFELDDDDTMTVLDEHRRSPTGPRCTRPSRPARCWR